MIRKIIIILALAFPQISIAQDVTFNFVDLQPNIPSGVTGEVDNSAHRLRVFGITNPNTSRYVYFFSNKIPLSDVETTIFEADISLPTGLRNGILNGPDPCGDRSGGNSMGTPVLFRVDLAPLSFVEISNAGEFGLRLEQVINNTGPQNELSPNGGIARTNTAISYWTGGPASFDPLGLTPAGSVGAKYHVRLAIDFKQNKVMAEIIPNNGFEENFNPLPAGSEGAITSPFVAVTNLIDYTKDPGFNGSLRFSISVRTNGNTDEDDSLAPGGTLRYIDREFTNIQVTLNQPIDFPTIPQLQFLFFPDDFNNNVIDSYWELLPLAGLNFVEEDSVLKLYGIPNETGVAFFLTSAAKRQDLTVEIDFMAPTGIQDNTSCVFRIQFDFFNYIDISINNVGYKLARVIGNRVDAIGYSIPLFGDETINFHRLKLSYENATGRVDAFIDSIRLDGIPDKAFSSYFTTFKFAFFANSIKDQYIERKWDNFNSIGEDQWIFRVTNTNNSGPGSLRQAIFDANSSVGPDSIVFNIPTNDPGYNPAIGVWTIQPDIVMPALEDSGTTIDGSTQSFFTGVDPNPKGREILLDGNNVSGNNWGFLISSNDNKIRNLAISRFSKGIVLNGNNSSRNIIENNYIGTDATGELSVGNTWGIYISEGAHNNLIGTDNIIAYNDSDGVRIIGAESLSNTITCNSITNNGGLGINNFSGGNKELTPPNITTIAGDSISGIAPLNSIVEVFSDTENEGKEYQGFTMVDSSGNFSFPLFRAMVGQYITSTATDSFGNTSEFSEPLGYLVPVENDKSISEGKISQKYALKYNFPNPFNPDTIIEYQLPESSEVNLLIYNTIGQLVKTLVKEKQTTGYYFVRWDGKNEAGHTVGSGVYFYSLRTKNYMKTCKMIILR